MSDESVRALISEIHACTLCAAHLPLGPRPVVQFSARSKLLITGQAPGTKVHMTGLPFNDASGERLRGWLGMDRATFYDPEQVAIVPMGFCYPGRLAAGGDCPPRPECAPHWRARILSELKELRLTLLVGAYAQKEELGPGRVYERVEHFRDYLPQFFPLPHPSWRTGSWERRTPWFGEEVLPALRQCVRQALAGEPVSL